MRRRKKGRRNERECRKGRGKCEKEGERSMG